jgi:hypothetical protein
MLVICRDCGQERENEKTGRCLECHLAYKSQKARERYERQKLARKAGVIIVCVDCNLEKPTYLGKRCKECHLSNGQQQSDKRRAKEKIAKENGAIIICSSCQLEKPLYTGKQCRGCVVTQQKKQKQRDNGTKLIICRDCGLEKIKHEGNRCKECCSLQHAIYRQNNKEIISLKNAEYRRNNEETIKQKSKIYRDENREIMSQKRRDNPVLKEKARIRAKNNKNKRNAHQKKRRATDLAFRLKMNISNVVNSALKRVFSSKGGKSTFAYLDYTPVELMEHLLSQMIGENSWMNKNNYGTYNPDTWDNENKETWTWSIDHIIPQSEFHYTSLEAEDFKKCWALSNLRPLSSKQNTIDGTNRTRHKKPR